MPNVSDRVLDNGLSVLDTEADAIFITSQEAANFTEATSTYDLGSKTFATGGAFGAPAAGTPNGRKVSSTAITDGAVSSNGTASNWAAVDVANSRLLAVGAISSPQVVTSGNTFSLASFDIHIPNQ